MNPAQSFCRIAKSNVLSLSRPRAVYLECQAKVRLNTRKVAQIYICDFANKTAEQPPASSTEPPTVHGALGAIRTRAGGRGAVLVPLGAEPVPVTQRSWQENTIYIRG